MAVQSAVVRSLGLLARQTLAVEAAVQRQVVVVLAVRVS
jgi:hypothetical protein